MRFPAVREGTIGIDQVQPVDARDLHAFLKNGDHFTQWVKDRIRQFVFTQAIDFTAYSENSEGGGAPRLCYAITIDMAKELAMVERNEQGRQARRYFIDGLP
ncbi:hypothetical protein FV219_03130 [Methylobacterium sp. WL122]|nr:hypothetical protein FV219_03130 [Methylobacterium sp. WL122]